MKKEIIKVQISLHTSEDYPQILAYNESQSIMWQGDVTKAVKKVMGKSHKKFFYGWLDDKKQLVIDDPAPWQEW